MVDSREGATLDKLAPTHACTCKQDRKQTETYQPIADVKQGDGVEIDGHVYYTMNETF